MPFTKDSKLGFIGAGRVGKALAVALHREGYAVVSTASRTLASAEALAELVPDCTAYTTFDEAASAADFVLITSTDDAIGPVATTTSWKPGQGVVHCSGSASLDALEGAADMVPSSAPSTRCRHSRLWRIRWPACQAPRSPLKAKARCGLS